MQTIGDMLKSIETFIITISVICPWIVFLHLDIDLSIA